MSWSRFGQERYGGPPSDVYTFPSDGGLECCGCLLRDENSVGHAFVTDDVDEFMHHLQLHRDAGHAVPDGLEDLIRTEAPEFL